MEVRYLLEQVPQFEGLKLRAEDNNHRQDSRRPSDKMWKGFQQRLLNILRVLTAMHTTIEVDELKSISQQLFFYVAETEHQLFLQRKKESVPGSVIQTKNVLFNSEDLKMERQFNNINRAGITSGSGVTMHSIFPPPKAQEAGSSDQTLENHLEKASKVTTLLATPLATQATMAEPEVVRKVANQTKPKRSMADPNPPSMADCTLQTYGRSGIPDISTPASLVSLVEEKEKREVRASV